ncbi:MAG: fasciclin domain-containing protein [Mycobacterium sp.]
MKIRTSKTIGAAAGIAAIALSVPLAVTAYADPAEPAPELEIPDPQGPGCDAFKTAVPTYESLVDSPVGTALQSIPDASTFYSAISGGFNPAVNIVPVLENGPYVVFAPTNEAFAKLPPAQLDALKADPAALSDLVYYHDFLGLLGNEDVKGQRPTQQGAEIKVDGEGGDIKVNDTAKLVCGAIFTKNARIYLIDTVLDPKTPPTAITPSGTSSTTTTTTTTSETPTTTSAAPAAEVPAAEQPMPAADAPIG